MRIINGYCYTLAEKLETGESCVVRFPISYYGKESVPFQQLFTWKIDWGSLITTDPATGALVKP